jgi:tRNA threonylcarbamoyladenosine biosynthesis protein TsaE
MSGLALHIATPEQMRALGRSLGRVAVPGDRFLLEGPFGAGKTTLVQGLAEGLEVTTPVSSPSFVIETQHSGRLRLYHIDLYRLDGIEPELLGDLEEHLFGDGVAAVEWAERLPSVLREDGHLLRLEPRGDARHVTLTTADTRVVRAATDA